MTFPPKEHIRICVVGLGYVGLPLAACFGRSYDTVGFDVNEKRVAALKQGRDATREMTAAELKKSTRLTFTTDSAKIRGCNVFVVAVPTPIDAYRRPDLTPLRAASHTVAAVLKQGDTVIYESTVFPGATEEVCVPILEKESGLICNENFYVGYSPERINPGDREHRLETIRKVTSGSTPEAAHFIDGLYGSVITAGTFQAASIRVAEAAKVIENTQRDVNIALVNELAVLFQRLGIDTLEVLEAAGTKWNFLPFRPGLVGGHCIGVDPYYLTHKAQEVGHHPEIILAGRRLNDSMGEYVAGRVVKLLLKKRINVFDSSILIIGLSFKPNCPDLRNTKVIDMVRELEDSGATVSIYDPLVDSDEAQERYGVTMVAPPCEKSYDAVVVAVAHREILASFPKLLQSCAKDAHVVFDLTGTVSKDIIHGRL